MALALSVLMFVFIASISYLLGMSGMSLPSFLFVTAIGRMPGTLILSLQGAEVYNGNYIRFIILLLLSLLVTLPCMLYRQKILSLIEKQEENNTSEPNEE